MSTVAEHVRVVLVEARRRGVPFGRAWKLAIGSLPRPRNGAQLQQRHEWLEALAWARPFYERAYIGRALDLTADPLDESAIVDIAAA